ncbi:hypothetical protein IJV79_05005 [bacterium]|nr:hypothetical protein [bacterium]
MDVSGAQINSYNSVHMDYSTRPSYMNKGTFRKDDLPGMNKRVGFGDVIYTMAQAGKAAGTCGANFMAIA